MKARFPVEKMALDGVTEAISWALGEGWQPGRTDAVPFHAADPDGFFRSRDGGRTVATLSVVRASPRLAFVGLYIVDPDYRGKGAGLALWNEVLPRFEGLTLGLDAVPEQVDTYASDGFEPAHGNARYTTRRLPGPEVSSGVVPASSVPFEDLVAFDGAHFFGPRPGFLAKWVEGEGREAVVTTEDGRITGFAASRRTSAGHRIGPVFAADPEVARALILDLGARARGPVAIDIPLSNRSAVDLLTGLGMSRSFETTRMYRGRPPGIPLDRVFGITTLELG